jgi:hypothetical protein
MRKSKRKRKRKIGRFMESLRSGTAFGVLVFSWRRRRSPLRFDLRLLSANPFGLRNKFVTKFVTKWGSEGSWENVNSISTAGKSNLSAETR